MKVVCTNILCHGKPFKIDGNELDPKQLSTIVCPKCGNVGAMYEAHVVSTEEMLRQIEAWRDKVLYRNVLKLINIKKLPANLDQQKLVIKKREVDTNARTKPITRKAENTPTDK